MPGAWSPLRRYRGRVAAGILCLVATSALATSIPWLLKRAIEALKANADAHAAARDALWIAIFAVLGCVIRIASRLYLFDAARKAEYDIRSQVWAKLMTLSPSFFRGMSTGEVIARMTSDVPALRSMWGPGVLNLANTLLIAGTTIVLLLRIDPALTGLALLPYPLLVLFARSFGKRFFRLSREVQDQTGKMSASLTEDLAGIHVVKSYTLEPQRHERFTGLAGGLLERSMGLVVERGKMMPLFGALGSLGVVITLLVGGGKVARGELSLGSLVAFQAYLGLLTWPTLAIGWVLTLFQRGYAAWARLKMVLGETPTIADGPAPAIAKDAVRGALEIRHLTVAFGGRKVLDGVSLTVPAGGLVAIVGPIGSGKSTLVDAIPRLVEIPEGTVFLDGHDVTSLPLASLRAAIGYAPQDPVLFSASIRENIAFGGGEGREREYAESAGLGRDLAAFPEGMETIVGERGITLSGGQRQRVALARAIAADPRVLILDDSLSSVDAQTEREILGHLRGETRRRTTLLISHRLAAVSGADHIVVLDAGKVVDSGTHDELIARPGLYAELYREQLTDASWVVAS